MPGRSVFGQCRDRGRDQRPGGPEPFVVAGLLRDGGEHAGQVRPGVPDPPGFGGVPQQLLRHREAEQLSIRQAGLAPGPAVA